LKRFRNKLKERKGYIILEATILIPVFLFSVVLLVYILQVLHFQEIIHFEACRNLASLSWESQLGGSGFSEWMYENRTCHDARKKIRKEIDIDVDLNTEENVYLADIRYPIRLDLPFGLPDELLIRDHLAARKWNGADLSGNEIPFSSMEEEGETYVYVFPNYGERYHHGNCFYLTRDGDHYCVCVPLSEASSSGRYTPCAVCY
jgi:hypothetical protein